MAQSYGPDVDVYLTISEWPRDDAWDLFGLFARVAITSNGGTLQPNAGTNTYNGYSLLCFPISATEVNVSLIRSTGANSSNLFTGVTLGSVDRVVANGEQFGLRCAGSTIEAYHFTPASTGASPSTIFGFGTQSRFAYQSGSNPTVLTVTNLNDSGAGSLRAAMEASGPRVVVFETSGTIVLNSDIVVDDPYLTVAGQTAPSPGITIRGSGINAGGGRNTQGGVLSIYTHDVLVQHIRIRAGDGGNVVPQTAGHDALLIYKPGSSYDVHDVVIDHCSISWAGAKNCNNLPYGPGLTYWRCIISEALYHAANVIVGPGEPSSLGMLLGNDVRGVTIAQCLFAHNADRNPEIHENCLVQFINNVVFDAGSDDANNYSWMSFLYAPVSVGQTFVDAVGNKYISRNPSPPFTPLVAFGDYTAPTGSQVFFDRNERDQALEPITEYQVSGTNHRVTSAVVTSPAYTVIDPTLIEDHVLTNAGARPLDRDTVDDRIVNEVTNRTGSVISSQTAVGGWPVLAANTVALTTPANPHTVTANGRTNLENWLADYAAVVEGTSSGTAGTWVKILDAVDSTYSAAGYTGFMVPGNAMDTDPTEPGYYENFGTGTSTGGAFPGTPVVDTFNRTNAGTLGTRWQGFVQNGSNASTAGIASNRATNAAFVTPNAGWGFLYTASTTLVAASLPSGVSPGAPGQTKLLAFGLHHPIPNPEDYESGRVSGKLRQLASIDRSLSTMDGDAVGTSVTVNVDDQDRATREALATAGTVYLDGLEGTFKVVSEAQRTASPRGAPSVAWRGRLKEYGLVRQRKAQFSVEDQLTSEYGPLSGRRLICDRKLDAISTALPPQLSGKGQQVIVGLVGDWGAITPGTGVVAEKGLVPVYAVANRQINGLDYTEFHVAAHACESIDIYGADAANALRVLVDPNEYGTTILAPGKSGWPFGGNYLDIVDPKTGRTHRVYHFFIQTSDIKVQSHLTNRINVAVNVCGMENRGDGTGSVVTDLFSVWQMLWDNWIAPNVGYHSGLYTGAPTWDDGTPMTDSASFSAAQALSARWIGGRGYQAGALFRDELARTVMTRFAVTAHCNYGTRMSGQLFVSLPDDTLTLTGLPTRRQPTQLRAGVVPLYVAGSVQNPITGVYDYDYDTNRYREAAINVFSSTAIAMTGNLERPAALELSVTRDYATAKSAIDKRLIWRRFPLPTVQLICGLDGLNVELGDVVLVTSLDGIGDVGYVDAPVRIMRHQFLPAEKRVILEGILMDAGSGAPGASGAGVLGQIYQLQENGVPVAATQLQENGSPVAAIQLR